MRTTVKLPESVYRQSEQAARQSGFSVEQFIVRMLERELAQGSASASNSKRVSLPLIVSKHPGTLDLANFDLDDLLA
jgi:hypothetical protein